jgi:putative spermidine/putrescine transport system ATP-binding protein
VSLDVAPGERFVVVGASGAGKTTLLRAVAGLTPVSGGRIDVAGRDVTALPPERRDAVYLHQTPLLFPHLSVFENVAFPLRVRRTRAADVVTRVRDALAAVRMDEFVARAPRTLSGGQRHRVALARAIVARPAVLLLDEPLSSLDPTLRDEVREAILALQRAYRPALVLVTHDFDEAGLIADRVAVLIDRRIVQTAPPRELFIRPATLAVARLLGVPNEIRGIVTAHRAFASPLGCIPLDADISPGAAIAVFRPDAVYITDAGTPVRVAEVRHRAQRSTAVVTIEGSQPAASPLEIPADPHAPPRVGDVVRIGLDGARVSIFPGEVQ